MSHDGVSPVSNVSARPRRAALTRAVIVAGVLVLLGGAAAAAAAATLQDSPTGSSRVAVAHARLSATDQLQCDSTQRIGGDIDNFTGRSGTRSPLLAAKSWPGVSDRDTLDLADSSDGESAQVLVRRPEGSPHTLLSLTDSPRGWIVGSFESCPNKS